MIKKRRYSSLLWIILLLLLFSTVLISFFAGRYELSISDIFESIVSFLDTGNIADNGQIVLFKARMPRIFTSLLVGAALSLSGLICQTIFRNPLASSEVLGVSSGSSFFACVALLAGASTYGMQVFSFIGGLIALGINFSMSTALTRKRGSILSFILVGMVINAIFQAGISISKYIADPYNDLQDITFWLLGSLSRSTITEVWILFIILLIAGIPVFLNRWKLNLLNFSDDEISTMGIDPLKLRIQMMLCATLLTSSSVAIGGGIAWIGLVIPHMARMIVGSDCKRLVPAVLLIGSTFMLIIDDLSRTLMSSEIPINILTAVIGSPIFLFLLIRNKRVKYQ